MSENLFLKSLNLPEAPWHCKVTGSGTHATHSIHDITGRTLASVAAQGGTVKGKTYAHTVNCITHAPQLLAALIEAQYLLDTLGYPPTQSLRDLIYNAGGPDIQTRVGPAVESTDNESQTNEGN